MKELVEGDNGYSIFILQIYKFYRIIELYKYINIELFILKG